MVKLLHYVDLVFYHYILHGVVLIDLKTRKTVAGDVGNRNRCLNYFAKEENSELENPLAGIVLGTAQNKQVIWLGPGRHHQ
jgi:hypothetical protein